MCTLLDIHDFIIRECIFNCPYDRGLICSCSSDTCNLSYDISLEMIENGYYWGEWKMIRIIITLLILLLIAFVGLFLYAWSYAKSQGYTLKQLWRIYNQIEDENKKG